MSAAVARGHGGDAGGDPPPNPNKIPTLCEASSKNRKKRGKSTSRNLDIAFKANGKKPLPIEFDLTEKIGAMRSTQVFMGLHHTLLQDIRRSNGGWVNDLAKEDHEAMLAEDGSTSSSSLNEKGIITKVLGERSGHNRGIGRKLKGSALSSFFEPPSPPPPPPPPQPTMNEGRVVDAVNGMHQYMHQMYNAFRSFQPDFQFPPPPTIDPRTLFNPPPTMAGHQTQQQPPAPSPSQQPSREDEEDDTDSDS